MAEDNSKPNLTMMKPRSPESKSAKAAPPMVVPDYPEGLKQIQHEPEKTRHFLPLALFLVFLFLGIPTIGVYFAMFANSEEQVTSFGGDGKLYLNAERHLVLLGSARVAISEGKLEEAKKFLGEILEENPDHTDAQNMMLEVDQLIIEKGLVEEGLIDAPDVMKRRHRDMLENARLALTEDRLKYARATLESMLKEDPEHQEAQEMLSIVVRKLRQAE